MSEATPASARRGGFRLSVVAAPMVFALAVAVSVFLGLSSIASEHEEGPAPAALAGYQLDGVMVGPDALAEINQLHGKEIEDVFDGWVGHYEENGTVWVAAATTEDRAKQLLDDMVEGIQKGGSPFTGLKQREYEGQVFFSVSDGKQMHFFYQSGTKVVWLAAPKGSEEEFLAATFKEVG